MSTFADRLRSLRDKKGLSQNEVGKMLGKSREAVSKYEIGDREPDLNSLATLTKLFNVTSDYILGLADESTEYVDESQRQYYQYLQEFEYTISDMDFKKNYLKLAKKIKDNNLDIDEIEKTIGKMIKSKDIAKHP